MRALWGDSLSADRTLSTKITETKKSPILPDLKPELELREEFEESSESPDEVYISIGVDVEKIFSSVPSIIKTPTAGRTTLSEAATTSLHIFKIPQARLADIQDMLVASTNLLASNQSTSMESTNEKTIDEEDTKTISIVEEALREMENTPLDLTFSGPSSSIISDDMLKDLTKCLPTSRLGCSMSLIFSTVKDGFSLNGLYRKTKNVKDISVLLIQDQGGTIFGALLSEKMHCSQRFYGTGESCVFHWRNGFKVYNWTRKNHYFMQGSRESFLIGVKNGHSAIWFDADLKHGRSEATDTFDNPVLCTLPKPHISPNRNSSTTTWANSIPSNCSLRDTNEPSSVAFVITTLELWEIVS